MNAECRIRAPPSSISCLFPCGLWRFASKYPVSKASHTIIPFLKFDLWVVVAVAFPSNAENLFFFVPVAIAQFSPLTYQINGLLYIRYNLIASIGFDLLTCLFERIYCTLFFLRRSECNLIFSNEKKNHHSQSSKPIPCKMQLVWWFAPHNRAYDAVDSQSQCASNIHNLHRDREINCEQQAREKKEIEFPKSITHSSHSTVNNSVAWTTCYGKLTDWLACRMVGGLSGCLTTELLLFAMHVVSVCVIRASLP